MSIAERQLEPEFIDGQRAVAVAHTRVQRWEAVRTMTSCLIALSGVAAALIPSTAPLASIIGLAWAAASSGLIVPYLRQLTRRAAELQEMFDTELFGIEWNKGIAGEAVPLVDVQALSRRLRPGGRRDLAIQAGWYDDLGEIPHPIDVLLCQEQNVRWDMRLRRRYKWLLLSTVGIWLTAGIVVGWLFNIGIVLTLLTWYVPSFAAVALAIETAAKQEFIGADKARLATLVAQVLEDIRLAGGKFHRDRVLTAARKIQDGIFLARQEAGRVPYAIYLLFKTNDEDDFASASERHRTHRYQAFEPGPLPSDMGSRVPTPSPANTHTSPPSRSTT